MLGGNKMDTDLLIIGGGPAGLSAAIESAEAGVNVTIADESFTFGGQLRHQVQYDKHLPQHYKNERGFQLCYRLIHKLIHLDIDWLPHHTFIGRYQDGRIGLANSEDIIAVQAKRIIVATGAAEEPIVFPGWTLPGVMTVGASQILMNRERVMPGKNALIVGVNDFSVETVQQLSDLNINTKGIVVHRTDSHARTEKMKELNIPLFQFTQLTHVSGREKVERAYLKQDGEEIAFDIDLVCIGGELSPILEPFEILDCELAYNKNLGEWLPKYDANFGTSNNSVYVAGNAAGITCMGGILTTGEIAGLSVAESSGAANTDYTHEKKQFLWNELYKLESSKNNVFDARLSIIKEFSLNFNKSFPKQLDFLTEG